MLFYIHIGVIEKRRLNKFQVKWVSTKLKNGVKIDFGKDVKDKFVLNTRMRMGTEYFGGMG
jgi:hypothetical protein